MTHIPLDPETAVYLRGIRAASEAHLAALMDKCPRFDGVGK